MTAPLLGRTLGRVVEISPSNGDYTSPTQVTTGLKGDLNSLIEILQDITASRVTSRRMTHE